MLYDVRIYAYRIMDGIFFITIIKNLKKQATAIDIKNNQIGEHRA